MSGEVKQNITNRYMSTVQHIKYKVGIVTLQKLVQTELDEIFADNPTRDITATDISKMKYLECCVKESLRLYPSVPWFTRQVNTDISLGKM